MADKHVELPGPSDRTSTSCKTWSLSNPYGPEYGSNLPLLLRRVADQMEHDRIQPMDFLGLTVNEEMTEHGQWFSVSVFWSPDDEDTGELDAGGMATRGH
jgi:hypothetical protein